ncbi:MAG: hypothetical protein IJ461_04540 [Clostridia bacterium]|nr:hypothetical protein [Clostridia bacterium]
MYRDDKELAEGMQIAAEKALEKTEGFFKKAFHDMAESAKAQHELDKAALQAVKMESKAQWEEAKMSPKAHAEKLKADRQKQMQEIQQRIDAAQKRIDNAKK